MANGSGGDSRTQPYEVNTSSSLWGTSYPSYSWHVLPNPAPFSMLGSGTYRAVLGTQAAGPNLRVIRSAGLEQSRSGPTSNFEQLRPRWSPI